MIQFGCNSCGSKLKVKDEFAGRQSRCPTCKQAVRVPMPVIATVAPMAGPIEGSPSSLHQAGVNPEVTLPPSKNAGSGQSIAEGFDTHKDMAGRYVLDAEIARGGMGAVLRGIDRDLRREVAVKFMLRNEDSEQKARFIEEAQITGQLEHPNIVPIHELGIDGQKRLYFSMKMVRGKSLSRILEDLATDPKFESEWSLGRLLNVLINTCHALAYAHSRNVIHRDLKPANIMVGDFGEVYVMDWGLAKVLRSTEANAAGISVVQSLTAVTTARDAELTQDGAVVGTPTYMPPEQARGDLNAIDQRSDIYSLGGILYAILTLHAPIEKAGDVLTVMMRVVEGDIKKPEARSPHRFIPAELSAIAMKALANDSNDRYPSVEAFRLDIERFLEGRSVSAKQDTTWEAAKKFARRNKGLTLGLALTLCVLFGSSMFLLFAWRQTNNAYAAFEREQLEKEKRTRESIPAFLKASRLAIQQREFDDALAHTKVALDYDPDNIEILLLQGQLLASRKEFAAAAQFLKRYLKQRPDDQLVAKLADLCASPSVYDVSVQEAIANSLIGQKQLSLALGLLQVNEQKLAIYRKQIADAWPVAVKSLKFDAEHRLTLKDWHPAPDLSVIQGIPLSVLDIAGSKSADLSSLRGMPLSTLRLSSFSNLKDLTPLRDLPLSSLELSIMPLLEDLRPLQGLNLTHLRIHNCQRVKDLTPLRGMPLDELAITLSNGAGLIEDATALRGMPLQSLTLYRTNVHDIEFVRGMSLKTLKIHSNSKLNDLSPIQGMPLQELDIAGTSVDNIAVLRGMPLTRLNLGRTRVRDLSPLEGMSLREFWFPLVPKTLKGVEIIRAMPELERINGMDAAIFWPKFDSGDIK